MSEVTAGLIANARRIAILEVTLKDMDKLERERIARIATLEARVASQKLELLTQKDALSKAVTQIEELEGDFAEAIDIIKVSGVAPKFVEKHK